MILSVKQDGIKYHFKPLGWNLGLQENLCKLCSFVQLDDFYYELGHDTEKEKRKRKKKQNGKMRDDHENLNSVVRTIYMYFVVKHQRGLIHRRVVIQRNSVSGDDNIYIYIYIRLR